MASFNRIRNARSDCAAALLLIVACAAACAGEAEPDLQEVVITAEKRASTVQDTPLSITVVTGSGLQAGGIADFTTLAQATPGVSLKSEGPGQTEIEMRGMSSSGGNSPTVGFYLDEVPLTPPAGAQNGKVILSPALYDLARVEVLRGPQGTLYGAGSMGGTVRLISNAPDLRDFHTSAQATLSGTDGGGFNHTDNLMVSVPLIEDVLAVRLVGSEAHTSGWIDRVVGDPFPVVTGGGATRGDVAAVPVAAQFPGSNAQQVYSLRVSLLWKPGERWSIRPSFVYLDERANGITAYDSDPGGETHYQPFDIAEPLTDRLSLGSLDVSYRFDHLEVTSCLGYWQRTSTQVEDGSEDFNNPQTGATYAANYGLPNPGYYGAAGTGEVVGFEKDPTAQFSEELRVASRDEGALSWVAGGFFSHYWATWNFSGSSSNPYAYMDLGTFQRATTTHWFDAVSPTTMEQYALFANATYAITERLKLDGGLRGYAYDYAFSSSISGWGSGLGAARASDSGLIRQSSRGVSPKLDLSYSLTPELMAYATIARGFRPGGGNAQYPVTGAYWSAVFAPYNFPGGRWPSSYRPDSVWSYELGTKTQWFDRRLTVNASVYAERWNDVQLLAFPGDWALNINGNHASIYGGDLSANAALGAGFVVELAVGYTHDFVSAGPHWQITPADVLPDVAPVNGSLSLVYSTGVGGGRTLTARLDSAYVDSRYSLDFLYGHSLNGEYRRLPGYELTNLRVGMESLSGWGVALFVNNVFNTRAQLENLFQETLPSAAFNRVVTNQPLTAGIDLTYRR